MKKRIYIKTAALVLVAMFFSSCQDWLDVNQDPSFPQTAPAEVLLPPIFAEMTRGELFDGRSFGCYIQNFASTSANYAFDLHGYIAGSDTGGEKWRQHYWSIGKNIDLIIEDAISNGKWWYVGAAYAVRAWSWQTSTDVYGEMILKQAWEPGRYSFDYDTQEEIYAEVVRLCNLALENFDKDDQTNTLVKGDLVFKGDRDKWKKFVYSILARNAHHLSNKASYDPDEVIAYVDQAMASNTDNFNVPHTGGLAAADGGNNNFAGPTRGNYNTWRQALYSINLVNGTIFPGVTDPRISFLFQPSTDAVYRGVTNGSAAPSSPATTVIPQLYGKFIFRDNALYPLMTYWEMQFIKAEAAFKKGDAATAFTAYREGIQKHMEYLTVSGANITAYMASTAVAQNSGELTLSSIMLQKYIAMWGHGVLETWVDMRRYRYDPAVYTGFTPPSILSATNNGKLAYRARPRFNSEYVWNVAALDKIGALALDYNTVEPWFIQP